MGVAGPRNGRFPWRPKTTEAFREKTQVVNSQYDFLFEKQ
jgi:hypothetical protein